MSLFWLTIIPQLLVFVFLGKIIIASQLELDSGTIQHWLLTKQWARKAVTLVALWRERERERERIICSRYSVEHHVLWSRISRAVHNHKRRSWGRWQYLLAYSVDPLDLNISYIFFFFWEIQYLIHDASKQVRPTNPDLWKLKKKKILLCIHDAKTKIFCHIQNKN